MKLPSCRQSPRNVRAFLRLDLIPARAEGVRRCGRCGRPRGRRRPSCRRGWAGLTWPSQLRRDSEMHFGKSENDPRNPMLGRKLPSVGLHDFRRGPRPPLRGGQVNHAVPGHTDACSVSPEPHAIFWGGHCPSRRVGPSRGRLARSELLVRSCLEAACLGGFASQAPCSQEKMCLWKQNLGDVLNDEARASTISWSLVLALGRMLWRKLAGVSRLQGACLLHTDPQMSGPAGALVVAVESTPVALRQPPGTRREEPPMARDALGASRFSAPLGPPRYTLPRGIDLALVMTDVTGRRTWKKDSGGKAPHGDRDAREAAHF